jgi:hypothetical protein
LTFQPQDKARLLAAYVKDNQIFCRVEHDGEITIGSHSFNLLKNNYFMMVVSGDTQQENELAYHIIKVVSDEKIGFGQLKPYERVEVEETTTEKVNIDKIYNGCGIVKNCFGIPHNCVERNDCTSFSSATKISENLSHLFLISLSKFYDIFILSSSNLSQFNPSFRW